MDITSSPLLLKRIDTCESENDYDGRIGVRISAIFVILVAGSFGSLFPILSSRHSFIKMPDFAFFAAKYFGSGVIVATSLIHLLQPANEALSNECLGPHWLEYPYAYGLCLFVVFVTFFVELVSQRYLAEVGIEHNHGPVGLENSTSHSHHHGDEGDQPTGVPHMHNNISEVGQGQDEGNQSSGQQFKEQDNAPKYGDVTSTSSGITASSPDAELTSMMSHSVASELGAILFLEFGIIFHSVFVGLTLAVSGEEFKTLYIVLCFHQLFEGLGLGTRIATAPWPTDKKWMPWLLAIAFGVTTPIAIAIGLGLRHTYPAGSRTALITNGIFDSISAGILLYTGLVELIANEFLHSREFKTAPISRVLLAFAIMCLGAALMALLGKWA